MKKFYLIFVVLLGGFSLNAAQNVDPNSYLPGKVLRAAQEALATLTLPTKAPHAIPASLPAPSPTDLDVSSQIPTGPNWLPSATDLLNRGSSSISLMAKSTWSYVKPTVQYGFILAASAYIVREQFFRESRYGHAPHLKERDNITHLNLTLTVRKNGWRSAITLQIDSDNDDAAYQTFAQFLNGNLTDDQKTMALYGLAPARNVPVLEQNQIYTFTFEGTVTYETFGEYRLQKESTVDTVVFGGGGQPATIQTWVQALWEKAVAPRIVSVWEQLPHHLIPAHEKTTYRATLSSQKERVRLMRSSISNEICTIEAFSLPELKGKLIDALAHHIFPRRKQELEVQIEVTTPKDRFISNPIRFAIDPGQEEDFVIHVPAFYTFPVFSVPFFSDPRVQRAKAAALWQPNFEQFCGEVDDPQQEPWRRVAAKQIAGTIIMGFLCWKYGEKLASNIRIIGQAGW